MTLPAFEYREPETLEEAVAILREEGDDARVIGGGTALVVMLRARLLRPRVLVGLGRIPGLDELRVNGDVRIGALVTHRQLERSPEVRQVVPLLAEACGRVGSPTIRNMGTLGGNLAYGEAASDPAPALLALDARVTVAGPVGPRTVPLDGFFRGLYETALGPGEILTTVHVARPASRARAAFTKYTCLSEEERAAVSVAVLAVPDDGGIWSDVRIGLGGVGPMPFRAHSAEATLRGRAPTADLVREAADVAAAMTDPLEDRQGSAEYRRAMTRVWVRRTLETVARS
jgi:carbon-monoxide dehydrogenase medium subunit